MKNNLLKIQEMLMNQMKRLDDNELMSTSCKDEVARGNAISQSANTFLKSVNVGIRVIEMSNKLEVKTETLKNELGINEK